MSEPDEFAELRRMLANRGAKAYANIRSLLLKLQKWTKEKDEMEAHLASVKGISEETKVAFLDKYDTKIAEIMNALLAQKFPSESL